MSPNWPRKALDTNSERSWPLLFMVIKHLTSEIAIWRLQSLWKRDSWNVGLPHGNHNISKIISPICLKFFPSIVHIRRQLFRSMTWCFYYLKVCTIDLWSQKSHFSTFPTSYFGSCDQIGPNYHQYFIKLTKWHKSPWCVDDFSLLKLEKSFKNAKVRAISSFGNFKQKLKNLINSDCFESCMSFTALNIFFKFSCLI